MKIFSFLLLFICLSSASSSHDGHKHHLVFGTKGLHAHINLPQDLAAGAIHQMQLEFRDALTHELKTPADGVTVILWMPDMGHGSAPTQVFQNTNAAGVKIPGSFTVKNLIFLMPGLWTVSINLRSAQGETETKTISVNIPNAGSHTHH